MTTRKARQLTGILALTSTAAVAWTASTASPQQREARLVAHYPLAGDLGDATGANPPMHAVNAPFVGGKAIFCNGQYPGRSRGACDVRTPEIKDLDLSAFTITAQFLVPRRGLPINPVFVGGETYRWLYVELRPHGATLGVNSQPLGECSVGYRLGVWHEAAITYDGQTATLYLDGVKGCSSTVALRTANQRSILLSHSGNASAFYGMLRDLKVYNGVMVPARRSPVADTLSEPVPPDLPPVDSFLMKCPTAADVKAIDADLELHFDFDPTKDDPLACRAAEGSRDLSSMKKRVYKSLLLMKQLEFKQPLPWTKDSLYRWFTRAVGGIRFRADIERSSCCGPGRTMSILTPNQAITFTDRWVEPSIGGGLDTFLLLLAHEARHGDGYPHTCGHRDQTPDELGSWGVQYYLARWLAEHSDPSFFTSGTIRYTDSMVKHAAMMRKTAFCK